MRRDGRVGRAGGSSLRTGGTRTGQGLAEVVVALGLLAGAVVGLAALFGLASSANRTSRAAGMAAILAAQKVEQVRGLAWGYGVEGHERTDLETDLTAAVEGPGGAGLATSPDGTLSANVVGFVDYLDENGRWLGNGASPPAGCAYVRRWSIRALPESPLDTLVIRVLVVRRGTEGRVVERGRLPLDAVQLTCLKARRGV